VGPKSGEGASEFCRLLFNVKIMLFMQSPFISCAQF
jgi:hypothetical protein